MGDTETADAISGEPDSASVAASAEARAPRAHRRRRSTVPFIIFVFIIQILPVTYCISISCGKPSRRFPGGLIAGV